MSVPAPCPCSPGPIPWPGACSTGANAAGESSASGQHWPGNAGLSSLALWVLELPTICLREGSHVTFPKKPTLLRGRSLGRPEALGDARQAPRWLGRPIPGKKLRHACRLAPSKAAAARGAGRRGREAVALGRDRPRQTLAPAAVGLPATSQAIGPQGPCVLRPRPPPLEPPQLGRRLPHRALPALHLPPARGAGIAQPPLMDLVACQAIGGRDEDPLNGGHGPSLPSPVHAGPMALGPPGARIALAGRLGEGPSRLGHNGRTPPGPLPGDRLGGRWTGGCGPDSPRDCHPVPPAVMWPEASGRRPGRLAMAEGTGTPNLPVAPRHAGR